MLACSCVDIVAQKWNVVFINSDIINVVNENNFNIHYPKSRAGAGQLSIRVFQTLHSCYSSCN